MSITGKLYYSASVGAIIARVTVLRWLSMSGSRCITESKAKEAAEDEVLIKDVGDKGVIILNRPKVLNTVNLSMARKVYSILKQWESSKKLVIIEGMGDKAFCAGGDVKSLALALTESKEDFYFIEETFRQNYNLNYLVGTYEKPYIAIMNGITMGGGVGLAIFGKYRIATEKTLCAVPETAIGLFPDAGATYFLSRLKGKLGVYLGLTGHKLKGVDVLFAGIATHFVPSEKLMDLKRDLLTLHEVDKSVLTILNKYQPKLNYKFSLAPHMSQIENCFSAPTVEEIIERLKKDNSEWAQKNIDILLKMSPSSLKITKKAIDEGKEKSLVDCLKIEFRLVCTALTKDGDFYEGVRALLIDKDQKPLWKPTSLPDVTNEYLNKRFAMLPVEKELQLCTRKLNGN
ncbi:PREDICTED: 3-hydroxyisobutyryl-CoA hydrolase, mitochondrial-like [Atta colombica]|nr:PREDICTED: 3-hydroxyisobutyryl-CoA hydrolase, mitochondrial-like [Atta colombica]